MTSAIESQVAETVRAIRGHRDAFDAHAQRLRTPTILSAFDPTDEVLWCLSVVGDALVRLRLFTEQNFNFVETLGTIAVARYTFELSVWLKLFELDPRYGLVYHFQLIDTQRRYWQDYRKQLDREVMLLNRFEHQEKGAHAKAMSEIE